MYGWGWSKRKNKWYNAQKFNISPSYIGEIMDLLHIYAQEYGNEVILNKIHEKLMMRLNEVEKAKSTLEKNKSRVPELKNELKEFINLVNSPKITEPKVHKFLKAHPWFFGTNYTRMYKSEKPITVKSRNDFLLQRFDKYFDILDLKSPKFPLFVKIRGNKKSVSKQLKDSISQVMLYLSEARTYYLSIKDQTGIDVYFPEGIIVIGRRKEEERAMLKIHNEFLNKIKIWTYDDLIDCAQETIKTYKNKKKK
jgi:hypothetical protein